MKIQASRLKALIAEAVEDNIRKTGMKVYVAIGSYDYENSHILAICKSRESAMKACQNHKEKNHPYDFYGIQEHYLQD